MSLQRGSTTLSSFMEARRDRMLVFGDDVDAFELTALTASCVQRQQGIVAERAIIRVQHQRGKPIRIRRPSPVQPPFTALIMLWMSRIFYASHDSHVKLVVRMRACKGIFARSFRGFRRSAASLCPLQFAVIGPEKARRHAARTP